MKKRRVIFRARPPGLDPARTAPFWQGVRAEDIVKARIKQYRKDAALKAAKRKRKKT
jgi:hypothetical protein